MPGAPDDIWVVQDELLAAAVLALDTLPDFDSALRGAPERRYVAPPGDLAADCEQLTVNLGPVGEMTTRPTGGAATQGRKHVYGRLTIPTVRVAIIRDCISIPKVRGTSYSAPTVDAQETGARQIAMDGWALWNGIFGQLKTGELLDRCTAVFWDSMTPIGPLGTHGGWILNLRVQLAGYSPDIGS